MVSTTPRSVRSTDRGAARRARVARAEVYRAPESARSRHGVRSTHVARRVCQCEQRLEQLLAIRVERAERRRERRARVARRAEHGVDGQVDLASRDEVGAVLPGLPHLRDRVAGRDVLARRAAHHAAVVVLRALRRDIVRVRPVPAVHPMSADVDAVESEPSIVCILRGARVRSA